MKYKKGDIGAGRCEFKDSIRNDVLKEFAKLGVKN